MNAEDEARLKSAMETLERDRSRADAIAAQLVQRYPQEPRAHFAYAAARSRMQDYASAARHLDIAACYADSALVQFNLGYCHRQLGDYERAVAHFRRGLGMPGADESLRVLAANTLAVVGRREEAARILGPGGNTPVSVFCGWMLGADRAAVRAYFAERPERTDQAVLFWMKHDCHAFGELDDKASLGRFAVGPMAEYWPESFVIPDALEAFARRADGGWWIFKPASLSGGQGMRLTRAPASLEGAQRGIAQRYVHPPFLLMGRKLNLRLLYCIQSVEPLRAYLWRDGLVFVSPHEYADPVEGAADRQLDPHVVNLLRAQPDEIPKPLGPLPAHVVPLTVLLSSGALTAAQAQTVLDGIARMARALTEALRDSGFIEKVRGAGDSRAFPPRFLGLDVGFDAALQPRLFEIERYPGIGGVSAQSAQINGRFRRQWLTFALADAPESDTNFLAT